MTSFIGNVQIWQIHGKHREDCWLPRAGGCGDDGEWGMTTNEKGYFLG